MIITEADFRTQLALSLPLTDEPVLSTSDLDVIVTEAKRVDGNHNAPDALKAWVAATNYGAGALVVPDPRNGYAYRTTAGGTSGAAQPTWPTTLSQTVVDNTVTWLCLAVSPWLGAWDLDAACEQAWMTKATRAVPTLDERRRDGSADPRGEFFTHCIESAKQFRRKRLVRVGLGLTPYGDRGY